MSAAWLPPVSAQCRRSDSYTFAFCYFASWLATPWPGPLAHVPCALHIRSYIRASTHSSLACLLRMGCQPQFRSDGNKINHLHKDVLGFSRAMSPIGNILTAKYTFNGFVTALREHLQLDSRVNVSNTSAGGSHFLKDNTHRQQYGRHSKSVQKYSSSTRLTTDHQISQSPDSFSESRCEGICRRCSLM